MCYAAFNLALGACHGVGGCWQPVHFNTLTLAAGGPCHCRRGTTSWAARGPRCWWCPSMRTTPTGRPPLTSTWTTSSTQTVRQLTVSQLAAVRTAGQQAAVPRTHTAALLVNELNSHSTVQVSGLQHTCACILRHLWLVLARRLALHCIMHALTGVALCWLSCPAPGTPIPYESLRTYFKSDPASSWGAYVAGCLLVLAHEKGARYSQGISILVASDVPEGESDRLAEGLGVGQLSGHGSLSHQLTANHDISGEGQPTRCWCTPPVLVLKLLLLLLLLLLLYVQTTAAVASARYQSHPPSRSSGPTAQELGI